MPLVAAWLAVLVPSAVVLWCFEAFVLRRRRMVRLMTTTLVPAIVVTVFFYADYWSTRTPPAEPGWDIFYAFLCFFAGIFTLVVTVPVWFVAEQALGKRAP